jgi:hypothetical protein
VKTKATVEAPSAEAARRLFDDRQNVMYSNVDVLSDKWWAVTLSVPVMYTFDLNVNADTEDEAAELATDEISDLWQIEDFVKLDIVTDYQYDIDHLSAEVQSVEAIEGDDEGQDDDTETAVPATATVV